MTRETDKPKYLKLKEYIIGMIDSQNLKPGEMIYSENELAEKFGISRHTVRQALSELVNEGWLYKEQGKGTFVDKRYCEAQNRKKTVGVITTYLDDYIFPSIIRGIDGVLTGKGCNIVLGCTYNQHEKERVCLENFVNMGVSALIAESTKSALPNPNVEMYRMLAEAGVPVLFIHGGYRELDFPSVVEDDLKAGYMATRHLIELGHIQIGGVFKIDDVQGHLRFAGFQKAHSEAGLAVSDSRVIWFDTDEVEEKFAGKGAKKLSDILNGSSAVVCYNDQISMRVMDAVRANGLSIPEDISIVSFDDSQLAVASEIKLTTVAHPKEQLGIAAAEGILRLLDGEKADVSIKMMPDLVIRGSTKKILPNE